MMLGDKAIRAIIVAVLVALPLTACGEQPKAVRPGVTVTTTWQTTAYQEGQRSAERALLDRECAVRPGQVLVTTGRATAERVEVRQGDAHYWVDRVDLREQPPAA